MAKQRKVATATSEIVDNLPRACADEQVAVEFMEVQRWGDAPRCARCSKPDVYQMKSADGTRNSRNLWRCKSCKRQYTVRVGTIMEDSPIPLRHWCYAFWAACSSKKGVSAKQIQRMTGLSYKSALFMMHRIRGAMKPINDDSGPLTGTVEVDERYIGGKEHGPGTQGRGGSKAAVLGMVEREGRLRLRHTTSLMRNEMREQIVRHIDKSSRLMTDELPVYVGIGRECHRTLKCGHCRTVEKRPSR